MTKKSKLVNAKVDNGKQYSISESVALLKEFATAKFDESIDVSVVLGVDAKKSDQNIRSASVLPNGTGKTVRVAVFAQGDNVKAAKEAGADIVGMDDLAEEIKKGKIDFDVAIASPDTMRVVGQLGQILGSKGLMPNPKVGTVTTDIVTAVKNAKSGQVRYRTDKGGIVHCPIGKISFNAAAIKQNLEFLIADLKKIKPASAKGVYLQKIIISSTMGPGLLINQAGLEI